MGWGQINYLNPLPKKSCRPACDYGKFQRYKKNARKGDLRKVAMAILIKRHTSASNIWIAERLGMGHDRSVSRLVKQGKDNETIEQQCKELEKMLQCED